MHTDKAHNVADLHLESEILPLFDHTHNGFARSALLQLLLVPLRSVHDIRMRQEILKGFIANGPILHNYTYARHDFQEVHSFLSDTRIEQYIKDLRWKLLFNEWERHRLASGFTQTVVLIHRLKTFYFSGLSTEAFPAEYRPVLQSLYGFLSAFHTEQFEEQIRGAAFGTKDMAQLAQMVFRLQQAGAVHAFFEQLALFEAYLSISQTIIAQGFCFPEFSDGPIRLDQAYHPLLRSAVRNSFTSLHPVLLLTGPNMSGKSTFLKAVGLCVYLAHTGVAVPAVRAELPLFDSIFISIDHQDDLLSGYSHFMAEVMRLKEVLVEAGKGKRCFAVFDELFRGTNIEDSVRISSATVTGLSAFCRSFFFISTHLHQLRELEVVRSGRVDTYYLDCTLAGDRPVFTYRLKDGWSELRVGQILFEQEGLYELLKIPSE